MKKILLCVEVQKMSQLLENVYHVPWMEMCKTCKKE